MKATSTETLLNRVPQIVLLYWVIKIASTTLGETGADMFSMTFEMGYGTTILIFLGMFALLLIGKLAMQRYEPVVYWLTFTASAIAGTAISDFIDRTLGLGYVYGSALLVVLLMGILAVWYLRDKSINVEWINNTPTELFYWLAFLVANTLGTAAGDFLADDLELGFAPSALLIGGLLTVIVLLYLFTKTSRTLLFWFAFVLTRPFGATFGDWLTKSTQEGGMELGTIGSSLLFIVILMAAVYWEMQRHKKAQAALQAS